MSLLIKRLMKTSLVLLFVMVLILGVFNTGKAATFPLIYINSVVKDTSVTISGVNFPAGQTFTVRMGAYGTLGIGGTVVGTKAASSGSSFTATYTIPASLVGASKIAIRLDSPGGYYAYNWFFNAPSTVPTPAVPVLTPPPGYGGFPSFSISSVVQGVSVTVLTSNFPAGQTFTIRMGEYGSYGAGGIVVGTTDSGSGGSLTKTYPIPAALADRAKIAIRMDCPLGYYSYNWFYNNSTGGSAPVATPVSPAVPGYVGFPVFMIQSVVKDSTVTISASNFPAGQVFTVRMGEYGTYAFGGTAVATLDSGAGGSFTATYNIPAGLAGRAKIAIRLETSSGYYYAYNWFYNN
jgi:hypothetical protein